MNNVGGLPLKSFKFHYSIGNASLGESSIEAYLPPHSIAYVCPSCGGVWARIEQSIKEDPYWVFKVVTCSNHENKGGIEWGQLEGSLLQSQSEGQWAAMGLGNLPHEAIAREFWLLIEALEKGRVTLNDQEKT